MANLTAGALALRQLFPDAESARAYLEKRRWPHGATCPACGEGKRVRARKNGFFRCNACLNDFSVRAATIFHRSKVPLNDWLYALYLFGGNREGISSPQLARQIAVTQKTAWFMLQRLKEACGDVWTGLDGVAERGGLAGLDEQGGRAESRPLDARALPDPQVSDAAPEALALLEAMTDIVLAYRPPSR